MTFDTGTGLLGLYESELKECGDICCIDVEEFYGIMACKRMDRIWPRVFPQESHSDSGFRKALVQKWAASHRERV